MPTYTYKCETNGHIFEQRQRFSDDALTECVFCGEPVRKVINSVGVVFKGKGFYVTDNRSKNSAAPVTNGRSDSNGASSENGASNDNSVASGDTSKASETKSEKSTEKASSAEK